MGAKERESVSVDQPIMLWRESLEFDCCSGVENAYSRPPRALEEGYQCLINGVDVKTATPGVGKACRGSCCRTCHDMIGFEIVASPVLARPLMVRGWRKIVVSTVVSVRDHTTRRHAE